MENKILKALKTYGRLPTSRLGAIVGANYETTIKVLNELEKEKKIKKTEETTATYWELK